MTTEHELVRGMLLRAMAGLKASHPLAKELLGYGRKHALWLLGLTPGKAKKLNWAAFEEALCASDQETDQAAGPITDLPAPPCDYVLTLGHNLSALLDLDTRDAAILHAILAFDRLRYASELADLLADAGKSLPVLIGEAAGLAEHEAERAVRQHILVRLGFVSFKSDWRGKSEMSLRWTLRRLLNLQPEHGAGILELMVGPVQAAPLPLEAFAHISSADFLVRLLQGAMQERAKGINILIHGPPGTGKTEFARTLAKAAGARLHAVGEVLDDGEEPDRYDRIGAFQMGQRLLGTSGEDALLFDEMEDFIGDAQPAQGDWYSGREGSKVFVNRLIETNRVPVIWTTNAIGNIDTAILRRMSYILKLDHPSREAALAMLDRIAAEESISASRDWADLIEQTPEAASVLRVSARAARLAGESDGGVEAATSLVKALRGQDLPLPGKGAIDLSLYESDQPIAPLVDALCGSEHNDVSLLLTGPPGTGKTALAHHFARAMDRPLMVRRTSDLLSKWVGETEANIAGTFADARAKGCVLLLDEVDSLLFDRSHARANWEVSQVNELLTWLDQHPLPVIAATNFVQRLDPATARRFVFKLALKPLSSERLTKAFEHFFAMPAPQSLLKLQKLTPGDFALVARQMRHTGPLTGEQVVARLKQEESCKPDAHKPIGF